jgi:uncharacterized membrane protein
MFELTDYLTFTIHGGPGGHGDGMSGALMQFLTYIESLSNKSPAEIFAEIMPGMASLENIHPLLVHFPIALFSSFVLIDLLGSIFRKQNWRETAGWFLYLGTLLTAATVAAGLSAADTVAHSDNVHGIMERHKFLAISVLTTSSVLSLWRILARGAINGGANVLYVIFSIILGVLVTLTADLGGLMVYEYGVAVEQQPFSMDQLFHQHDHSATPHGHSHSH